MQLLNRFVPASVLAWLAADAGLMHELLAFLSGDNSARSGAICELVLRAATESVRRTLRVGLCGIESPAANLDAPGGAQSGTATQATDEQATPDEEPEYLEDVDEKRPAPAPPRPRESRPNDGTLPTCSTSSPSQPSVSVDPLMAGTPDAASRFIAWLQQGIADGTIRVNESRALVHGVDEGMLLVSPRIFREFAKRFGEDGGGRAPAIAVDDVDTGKWIQRQVLRAGWHLRADKGVNILTYQVMRKGRAVSRLSGVVITNPARFIDPVPPVNPVLARPSAKPADA